MIKITTSLLSLSFLLASSVEANIIPIQIGNVHEQIVQIDYSNPNSYQQVISHPGASFIKLHFAQLNLIKGDELTISDPNNLEVVTLTAEDNNPQWALSISSDRVIVRLIHKTTSSIKNNQNHFGIIIDQYTHGFNENDPSRILSTCGNNERQDVVCFKDTNPKEYKARKPIAKLILDHGMSSCTAWRVDAGNHMMTNHHCISSQKEVESSEVWFNYENKDCGISSTDTSKIIKVKADKFLTTDAKLDFALFTINPKDSKKYKSFGYLELDPRVPKLGEHIFIPQHGSGKPKQFGINSDKGDDAFCQINSIAEMGADGGSNNPASKTDVGYYCDTIGGSSGSPVISEETNKVIALHHFGGCDSTMTYNQGIRMNEIWPKVKDFLSAPAT